MYLDLTEDNLEQILQENPKVMVQYGAGWCGNCRIMKPKFKKMASENEAITFVYVDAEQFVASRKLAQVDNLPTFAAYENQKLVNQVQTNQVEPLQNLLNEITHH